MLLLNLSICSSSSPHRHIWTGYRPYGEAVRGLLKQHVEQQQQQQQQPQPAKAEEGGSPSGSSRSGSDYGSRVEGGLSLDPGTCERFGQISLASLRGSPGASLLGLLRQHAVPCPIPGWHTTYGRRELPAGAAEAARLFRLEGRGTTGQPCCSHPTLHPPPADDPGRDDALSTLMQVRGPGTVALHCA